MKPARILLQIALAVCLSSTTMYLTSCQLAEHKPLVAEGLLTGEPCGPPCWQGLVPGLSTEDDVRQFLRSGKYAVGPYAVHPGSHAGLVVMWWDRRGLGGQKNVFDIQDGVLSLMGMYTDSEVTVEQVVRRYGTPDRYKAGLKMSGRIHTVVSLFYREFGMILNSYLYDDLPQLRPETQVARVWYFEPVPLEEAIATLREKKGQPLEDFELERLEHWHDWQGYGPVEPDHGYP